MTAQPNIVLVHGAWADALAGVASSSACRPGSCTPCSSPLSGSTFQGVMGIPTWKSQPSWFLVAQNDEAIPPDAERQFAKRMGATTVEVPASHVAMVSTPTR
jgi:hypothetical protein